MPQMQRRLRRQRLPEDLHLLGVAQKDESRGIAADDAGKKAYACKWGNMAGYTAQDASSRRIFHLRK